MTEMLTKGRSGPIAVDDLIVSVQIDAEADLSAILVTARGKVRADTDLVFYNQPEGPGIRLLDGEPGRPEPLAVRLGEVPADVDQVRFAVVLDGPNSTFDRYPTPIVSVWDAQGNALYRYPIDELTNLSAAVVLELCRQDGQWDVRAVGQGYPGGFAQIATEHGVAVDNSPAQAGAAAAVPEIGLHKAHSVDLIKGQKVTLRKEDGDELTYVKMGLGWDPIRERGRFGMRNAPIDLDASAMLFAGDKIVDIAYYAQLNSRDGSIRHQGDNLTGEGEGDDEVILVDLTRVPIHVTTVIFIVTSYRGHTFEQVSNAFCRLVDGHTDKELARYTLLGGKAFTGMVMAKVYRTDKEWKLQAIGEGIMAKHPGDAAPVLGKFIGG